MSIVIRTNGSLVSLAQLSIEEPKGETISYIYNDIIEVQHFASNNEAKKAFDFILKCLSKQDLKLYDFRTDSIRSNIKENFKFDLDLK